VRKPKQKTLPFMPAPNNRLDANRLHLVAYRLYYMSTEIEEYDDLSSTAHYRLRYIDKLRKKIPEFYPQWKIIRQQLLETGYLVIKNRKKGCYYIFLDPVLGKYLQPQIEGV
jgi:hypothetical protein